LNALIVMLCIVKYRRNLIGSY